MNLTWKKTAAMVVGGLLTAALVAPVLADTTTPTDRATIDAKPGIHRMVKGMGMMGRDGKGAMMGMGRGMVRGQMPGGAGMMMGFGQDQVLADAAKGAGMTVEEYQAKLQTDRQANRQTQAQLRQACQDQVLADAAKGAGMTVEEYQAKLQIERQTAMLERYAEKQGISVDEAKAKMKDKVLNQIGNMAKRLGITLEDLKVKFGQ